MTTPLNCHSSKIKKNSSFFFQSGEEKEFVDVTLLNRDKTNMNKNEESNRREHFLKNKVEKNME